MNICLNNFLKLSSVRILVSGKTTIIKQEHLTMWIVYIVLHLGKGVRQDIIISSLNRGLYIVRRPINLITRNAYSYASTPVTIIPTLTWCPQCEP